jgi:hypothetical protein
MNDMPNVPKIAACCLALIFSAVLATARPAKFETTGRRVTVTTDRYIAEFNGLSMTRVENRLTGQVYAAAKEAAGGGGVTIRYLRPAVPDKRYTLAEQTRLGVRKQKNGLTMVFTGLQHGETFDEGLRLALDLVVDPGTGDLLISPRVNARIEKVIGVRDRGVLNCTLNFGPLSEDLRLIIPASDGFSVTKDDTPEDWSYGNRWPKGWEVALIIAEGREGCLGLWADEPELNYGRLLHVGRDEGWNVALTFETADRIETCTEITGATWRFNVFEGYWARAAERYVRQMEEQWPDLERLEEGTPAWADRIRVVITGPTPAPEVARRYARLLPPDTLAVFTCQEWMKGWNSGAIREQKVGMEYFPNWPLTNPKRYHAREDMPAKFDALEKMDIHIFPYTNPNIVSGGHPWIRRKIGARRYFGYRIWQRMHPELCRELVDTYGVSGIYEDCSWVVGRHKLGAPDGENWYQGSVRMRRYFDKLMPDVAVMGERNNEVTFRGQKFALSITQWGGHAHPINAYIFGPFLRMWNLQLQPSGFDADDIRGWMTPWPTAYEENPMQERRMLRKRGIVFAEEQLRSYWPEEWEPEVMHYFKREDGEEYRFVRRNGTRFVKITPVGEELIYWRLHGVSEAEVGEFGVQGWLGYDGDHIVGLNPRAVYITLERVERPPVTITEVPSDAFIRRCLIRDGFWLTTFGQRDKGGNDGPITVRVRSDEKNVSFCGAQDVRKLGKNEYEVTVRPGDGLAAYWSEPDMLEYGTALADLPAVNTISRRDSGLISRYGGRFHGKAVINQQDGSPTANEEGNLAWLVRVPEFALELDARPWLVFRYGTKHAYGDGANYMVRVNGRTCWKRYRPQVSGETTEAGEPLAPKIKTGAIDLSDFEGEVVVLELVVDGHGVGTSETIAWHRPTLKSKIPGNAETDDEVGGPVLPGGELGLGE